MFHIQRRSPATKVSPQITGKLKICFVSIFPISKPLALRLRDQFIYLQYDSLNLGIVITVTWGKQRKASWAHPVNTHCSKTVQSTQPLASATLSNKVKKVSASLSLNLGIKRKVLKISYEFSLPWAHFFIPWHVTQLNSVSRFLTLIWPFLFAASFFPMLMLLPTKATQIVDFTLSAMFMDESQSWKV